MQKLSAIENRENFGKAFRKMRLLRGTTQEKLGEKIGSSREWVSKIECGKSSPNYYDVLVFMRAIEFESLEEINSFLEEATSDVPIHTR
ncbi:MAG: helix-turn-helix domain-containing protein [Clostridiales bacterium]|nr:helix-turn-helix domain-containing protein [Clostridiales bacterium]